MAGYPELDNLEINWGQVRKPTEIKLLGLTSRTRNALLRQGLEASFTAFFDYSRHSLDSLPSSEGEKRFNYGPLLHQELQERVAYFRNYLQGLREGRGVPITLGAQSYMYQEGIAWDGSPKPPEMRVIEQLVGDIGPLLDDYYATRGLNSREIAQLLNQFTTAENRVNPAQVRTWLLRSDIPSIADDSGGWLRTRIKQAPTATAIESLNARRVTTDKALKEESDMLALIERAKVAGVWEKLSLKERFVIEIRYQQGKMPFSAIGELLNVSRGRAQKIFEWALISLKQLLNEG
jgi:hypothetical protein